MNKEIPFPFYVKLAFTLISLIAIVFIFYIAQSVIIPLMIAFLFAILLRPIVQCCTDRFRFPHVLGVLSAVLCLVLIVASIIAFISIQVTDIAGDFNKIEHNFMIHLDNLKDFAKDKLNLSTREEEAYIEEATNESMAAGKKMISSTLLSMPDKLVNVMLIPIYTFLILLYRTHFMTFLARLFSPKVHEQLRDIVESIKGAVKSYLVGLMIQMVSVSVLTTIGYMIIGLEYAILLGIITGILNLIPYLGILTAAAVSIIASMTTSPELSLVIGVILVNLVVQFIDNNILVPLIVSSKVQVNALVSIVGIIVGGAIAGIAGMFLAIPVIAILKVIFDRVEELRPWGYLIGDDLPHTYRWGRIKLPMYDYGAPGKLNIQVDVPVPRFTETTTNNATPAETENQEQNEETNENK
jgi:predicted PurR-regulated permease PerM